MFLRRIALAVAAMTALVSGTQAAAAEPDDYVALGDSYSSGNGTYAANLDVGCYRSTYAYPYLVATARANTQLTFVACQGATTEDVLASQLGPLDAGTDIVSITIGGNDIGFGDLIIGCAGSFSFNCQAAVDEANRKISEELPAKLDRTYAAIRAAAPGARVVVLGYGRFFGTNLSCPAASGVTAQEATSLNGVADNLDATIADRVRAAGTGFSYQSSIARFTGHDICAADPYHNGSSWSAADMYHPTRSGHANGLAYLLRQVIG